jgi:integration host factor subunit beta
MTKADLIEEVSKLSSLTKKETELIVNTVFDNITDALAKGDKVELRGFGKLRIRHRNSRKGPQSQDGRQRQCPREARALLQGRQEAARARQHLEVAPSPRGSTLGAVADGVRSVRRGGNTSLGRWLHLL